MADDFSEWAVFRRLEEHHPALAEVVWDAWSEWGGLLPKFPAAHARVRRNVVHSFIVREARRVFQAVDGVKLIDTADQRFFLFVPRRDPVGDLLLQFKYLDGKYRSRNFPTPRATAFDKQIPLPGLPAARRLTVGYRLDDVESDVESVHVVHRRGKTILWQYPLSRPGSERIADFPSQNPLFPMSPTGGRVRAKQDGQAEERKVARGTLRLVATKKNDDTKR